MKIVTMIIGILILIGGLSIIGLVVSSNAGRTSEVFAEEAKQKATEAEKKWKLTGSPEDKVEFDKWLKSKEEFEKNLQSKKSEQQTGYIIGGVLVAVGIGLFGLSFIFEKRRE